MCKNNPVIEWNDNIQGITVPALTLKGARLSGGHQYLI